ncbi:Type I Polyketide synthases (Type I PKS) [Aspergillus tanneri]|uniref:Type I Polyketide synthases (Type I PKS) n=1 Tax=Aspergillus tanneri TaxID=1220188 RepID=A0A5M9N4Y4_9EURO|nr:Type I Polyketide synthases (Type I PKS) [Aspergillus tanneri]KAA8652644.1 Type I Polyketide synthases (Type I PKS) [Aspergillus tanneri]
MPISEERPLLVVCGPQTGPPDQTYLSRLHSHLTHEPDLRGLKLAVTELPMMWKLLLKHQLSLHQVPGERLLTKLAEWATTSTSAIEDGCTSNMVLAVLTVISHIVEYTTYLKYNLDDGGDGDPCLQSVRNGGIQGLCIGFLSATALACARSTEEVVEYGVVAMRLALCVGAWLDLDQELSQEQAICVSARWPSNARGEEVVKSILEQYPQTYLSVRLESCSATITTTKSAEPDLIRDLTNQTVLARRFALHGRFHSPANQAIFRELQELCARTPMLRFPEHRRPLVPLRRNDSGELVGSDTPLHELALRCILVETAEWHATLTASISAVMQPGPDAHATGVLLLGQPDCVPGSLLANSGLHLFRPVPKEVASDSKRGRTYPEHSIAVVGAACNFADAGSLEEFWDVIREKRSTFGVLPAWRYDGSSSSNSSHPAGHAEARNALKGSFINAANAFDHTAFQKSPREALYMDPQHRLALQLAYHTLESAGYFAPSSSGIGTDVGCYLGLSSSDYEDNVNSHAPTAFSFAGTSRAFASGRISHFFGWKGPSIVIDTACSSSAVAIHTACKAIQLGECTAALAGGVNLITSPNSHHNLGAATFLSPTGACRPFGKDADGYCRGEGGGFVLLKKLASAIADQDRILGVLVGSAVNHSTGTTTITLPSSDSQIDLYRNVIRAAGMHPDNVSYVEAHGTGTPKGDPVESRSIREAFGGRSSQIPLHIGSVKGNIGHTEGASGVASLIKVLLMLQHRQIPPQANFETLNPDIPSLKQAHLDIPREAKVWQGCFRTALVNNYGAAGTNAALMVCEPPPPILTHAKPTKKDKWLKTLVSYRYPFLITSHSSRSLDGYCRAVDRFVENTQGHIPDDELLPSIAFHLSQRVNPRLSFRKVFSVASLGELKGFLRSQVYEPENKLKVSRPVVLVFSGQSGNTVRFSEDIYRSSSLLRHHLDLCDRIVQYMGLRSLLPRVFTEEPFEDLVDLHCALFSLQYTCAAAWIDAGLEVKTVIGHSFGQLTALCVAGVLSVSDTLKLIAGRASLIQNNWGREHGTMLSVDADIGTVQALMQSLPPELRKKVEVACYNTNYNHVLSGEEEAISMIEDLVRSSRFQSPRPVSHKRLTVTHGFHSQLVDCIMEDYQQILQELTFHEPIIPIETCSRESSWGRITPHLVAQQSRDAVYFADAIGRIEQRLGSCTWVEAGSGSTGVSMARRALMDGPASNIHSFYPMKLHGPHALASLRDTTIGLWGEGIPVQFWLYHRRQSSYFKPLESFPQYHFEQFHHWLPYANSSKRGQSESDRHSSSSSPTAAPKLLSLVQDQSNEGAQVVEFAIDQRSQEYSAYVSGRTVLGHILCPASVYFEIASRALNIVCPASALPSRALIMLENVKLHAPFGLNLDRHLRLQLQRQTIAAAAAASKWDFTVTSHSKDGNHPNHRSFAQELASGTIMRQEQGNSLDHRSLLQRLVSYGCCQALQDDPEVSILQGSFVDKALAAVANYRKAYSGIRSIRCKGSEILGDVVMPTISTPNCPEAVFNPPVLDNFILVVELHINNNMQELADSDMFLCKGFDAVLPCTGESDQGPWRVYAMLKREREKEIISDIFVFHAQRRALVLAILGAHFSKVPVRSFQCVLDRANGSAQADMTPEEGFPVKLTASGIQDRPFSPTVDDPATAEENGRPLVVESLFRNLVHEVTGTQTEAIVGMASLRQLGIDSLNSIELQTGIKNLFSLDIPIQHYREQDTTFAAILQEIHTQIRCRTDNPCSSTIRTPESLDISCSSSSSSSTSSSPSSSSITVTTAENSKHSQKQLQQKLILQLSDLIAEHLNCPKGLSPDTPLRDMGMDSLVAIDLSLAIEKMVGKRMDLKINGDLCLSDLLDMAVLDDAAGNKRLNGGPVLPNSAPDIDVQWQPSSFPTPFHQTAQKAFFHFRQTYSLYAQAAGFAGFYSQVYPKQSALVLAYITEAFLELGCDLGRLNPGEPLPTIVSIPRHQKLTVQCCQLLEEAGLITSTDNATFIRTSKPLQHIKPSESIHREILAEFPDYKSVHELLHLTASRLADCLSGKADALQLLFHDQAARDCLETVYRSSPMFATGNRMLGAFLSQFFLLPIVPSLVQGEAPNPPLTESWKSELALVQQPNMSSIISLVSKAEKKFSARYGNRIEFAVLDIEQQQPSPQRMMASYDLVISSNCIHATKSLPRSCSNINKLLRDDGMLCLLELTRPQGWLDCVFGLLEGWWRFEDGRTHVLSTEDEWKQVLMDSGFQYVDWTDDGSWESSQFRLFMALKRLSSGAI